MKKTQTKKKSGTAKTIAVLALSAIMLIGGGAVGYGAGTHWTYKRGEINAGLPNVKPGEDDGYGGSILTPGDDTSQMQFQSREIPRSEYIDNGISPKSESAFTLTAMVYPEEADNKLVDWSIAWQNANSAWANDKNLSDYYSINATSDGSLTAIVECYQAFAEPIIITCSLRESSISATVRADYVAKFLGIEFTLPDYEIDNYPDACAYYSVDWSIGTITGGVITFNSIQLCFPSEFYTIVSDVAAEHSEYLNDYYNDEVNYDLNCITLRSEHEHDSDMSQSFYDWFDFNDDVSPQNQTKVRNVFHKALKDKYGNNTKVENCLLYEIDYSYTIDGQTVPKHVEIPASLYIDVIINPTSISISEGQIKH